MTERQRNQSPTLMAAALISALLLIALPGQSWGAANCSSPSGDTDGDGLTDAQECSASGITLIDLTGVVPATPLPACAAGVILPTRASCVDPNSKDLFAVLVKAPGSLIPTIAYPFCSGGVCTLPVTTGFDPFTVLSALGITVHYISPAYIDSNRILQLSTGPIATSQKSVKVLESLDTNGTILGVCNWGTPDDLDGCVVYTKRIANFINSTCDSVDPGGTAATICTGGTCTQTTRQVVINEYIRHTISHEIGHSLGGLSPAYNSSYGGYHYKTGAGYIMDQSVSYTAKSGKCSWNISFSWNATLDPPGIKLKP